MPWIIGDIHGCLYELQALLDRIPDQDALLFLGDYIDRGPNSAGVIDRIMRESHRSIYLCGNHEEMMAAYYRALESGRQSGMNWLHPANGGLDTLNSYGLKSKDAYNEYPARHRDFLQGLKLYFEGADFIAVHAGVRIAKDLDSNMEKQVRDDMLWIRAEWISNERHWTGKRIIYGHTTTGSLRANHDFQSLRRGSKSLGIDTGCVYGGYLTAVQTETEEIIQIKARQSYV